MKKKNNMENDKTIQEIQESQEKMRTDQEKGSRLTMTLLLTLSLSLLISIVGSALVCTFVFDRYMQKMSTGQSDPVVKKVVQMQDDSIVEMVENVSPAVVSIVAKKEVLQYRQMSPFDLFFGVPQQPSDSEGTGEKQKVGGGTGFFISQDGMVVTNRHVVADTMAEYTVLTNDGTEHAATVLARDEMLDFAVLKVEGDNFTAVDLGDSDNIKLGQTVVAIGNSLGEFSNSVSRGIVSGKQRTIVAGSGYGDTEELSDILQTDAAINPGNSGGPLLDISGRVIGINTAVAQGAENVGFAIPINQVMRLIEDVKTHGKISRPFIGVRYVALTDEVKDALNVSYDHGVLIVRGEKITDFAVMPGSPADKAGLVENDIILEINGVKIDEENTLAKTISTHNVGDTVTLKVWHKGDEKEIKLLLEDKASLNKK